MVEGQSNARIADRLGISARTVQSHVANALTMTGARSRVQLAVFALCRCLARCDELPAGAWSRAEAIEDAPVRQPGERSVLRRIDAEPDTTV